MVICPPGRNVNARKRHGAVSDGIPDQVVQDLSEYSESPITDGIESFVIVAPRCIISLSVERSAWRRTASMSVREDSGRRYMQPNSQPRQRSVTAIWLPLPVCD